MWRISAFDREGREVASLEAERGEITIGREADRRVMLPSPSVSRKHARLVLDGPQPYIVDEGSANGVLVNGVRISQPTAVVPGVRVDIAEFYLEFEDASPGASQPFRPASGSGGGLPAMRLVAEGGPFAGRILELAPTDLILGRAGENELVLDDGLLSRRHCRIRQTGPDRVELEDLNSSNGTYVNGQRAVRLVATIGDVVRFGELQFRVEGDFNAGFDEAPPEPTKKPIAVYAGIGALSLALVVGVGVLLFRGKPAPAPAKTTIGQIADQAAAHLKAGKEKLVDRKFDAAVAEFEQVLELDPANTEARRLKATAESEPLNDKTARQVTVKTGISNDRPTLEDTIRLLTQIPAESVFHDGAAAKVGAKLASFGEAQCRAKRWSDCQWAICKAREVSPASSRPGPSSDVALRDAERKLARERGFVACKAH